MKGSLAPDGLLSDAGNYLITGTQDFNVTGAGSVRFYVAGDQRIELKNAFQASLYAPRADVVLSGLGEVYGALFVNSLIAPGSVAVHYDRNVLRADQRCEPEPSTCLRCDECDSSSTCIAGQCSACSDDQDCCQPLVCHQGQCSSDL